MPETDTIPTPSLSRTGPATKKRRGLQGDRVDPTYGHVTPHGHGTPQRPQERTEIQTPADDYDSDRQDEDYPVPTENDLDVFMGPKEVSSDTIFQLQHKNSQYEGVRHQENNTPSQEDDPQHVNNDPISSPTQSRLQPPRAWYGSDLSLKVFPDPYKYAPILLDVNPHFRETRSGIMNPTLSFQQVPFQDTTFPRFYASYQQLTANIVEGQLSDLVNDPSVFVIVPFDAGHKLYDEDKNLIPNTLEFLQSFQYDNLHELEIVRPSRQSNTGGDFGAPWPIFLINTPPSMTLELLYYGWFVVSPNLTFAVTRLDPKARSWHIGNFQSNSPGAIRDDPDTIQRLMGDFKKALYKDKTILDLANRCFRGGKDGVKVTDDIA
ncbi:hypothetical protein VKT23_014395 [Stygiomarasmius scandens]|uniref:Uncharacterized protein n=1 Tax=Marasmiellus scandens TaxID=2682957 RepID=A0ABR1J0S5_9AGAR